MSIRVVLAACWVWCLAPWVLELTCRLVSLSHPCCPSSLLSTRAVANSAYPHLATWAFSYASCEGQPLHLFT